MTKFSSEQINVQRVSIKKELIEALRFYADKIIIEGELAEVFGKTQEIETVETSVLSVLAASIPRNRISDRLSMLKIINLSISTGLSIGVIKAMGSIGIATVIVIYRDYDVEFDFNSVEKEAVLTKRRG